MNESGRWKMGAAIGAIALALVVGTYMVLSAGPSGVGSAGNTPGSAPASDSYSASGSPGGGRTPAAHSRDGRDRLAARASGISTGGSEGGTPPSGGGSGGTPPAAGNGGTSASTATVPKPKPSPEPAPPKEEWTRKVVPVLSVGEGIKIGAVLVGGPKSYVDQTKAVVMLEGNWRDVIVYQALVPIHTEGIVKDLSRVPFVGVIGIIDLKVT